MTIFEYLMVMVSLILALGLAQGLRGLTELVTSKHSWWVHTVWVLSFIFLAIQTWWAYWDLTSVSDWRFWQYQVVLVIPVLTFAVMYLLIPATRSSDVDWRAHFYRIRTWLYTGLMLVAITGTVFGIILLDTPFLHPYRLFHGTIVVIAVIGILSERDRVHEVLCLLFLSSFIVSQIVIRGEAGALIPI